MVLENIDDIQWDKLDCAYGDARDVPLLLQHVSKAESEIEWVAAYNKVLDFVHRDEIIYPATAPTVHFLMQLLAANDDPHYKIRHCFSLGGILLKTHMTLYPPHISALPESITSQRSKLTTYDAFANNVDIFIDMLSHDSPDVRTASLAILGFLVEQSQQIFPAVVDCIEKTDDVWTQAVGAWAYTLLVYHSIKFNSIVRADINSHINQVLQWLEDTDNPILKYTAAISCLLLQQPYSRRLPEPVFDAVIKGMNADSNDFISTTDNEEMDTLRDEFLPFDHVASIISLNCRRFSRPDLWLRLLPELELTPMQAHIYCREMMELEFYSFNRDASTKRWNNWDHLRKHHFLEVVNYRWSGKPFFYRPGHGFANYQPTILKTIINCDPFWELPSNLFSFYYRLPDDRDELREMIP